MWVLLAGAAHAQPVITSLGVPPGMESLGTDLTGWEILEVNGLSSDGSAITGYGSLNGQGLAFLITGVTYDADCDADCDQSGGLTIDDFVCFQTTFALGDPAADCDGNGLLDIDDFICFQTLFALGC